MTCKLSRSNSQEHLIPKTAVSSSHGLGMISAALFVVGEIAGTGVLALPHAVAGTNGFPGVLTILVICLGSGYTGVFLGKCWMLVEARNPDLTSIKVRNPYGTIGYHAMGRTGEILATVSMFTQLFGGSVVQMLICAEIVELLIQPWVQVTFCMWILIIGLLLIPFTWFGSPVDFVPVAAFAMGATAISSLLIIVAVYTDPMKLNVDRSISPVPSIKRIFLSMGTFIFAFGGASVLPTIQNDMRNKNKFSSAIINAFILMLLIYLPVSITGFHVYGDDVQSNVIRNLTPRPLVTLINVLMAGHVFCAFLILINPINLNLENSLGLHHSFNMKRSIFRSSIVMIAIFVGATIPKFEKLINLVGGCAVSLQTFILPPLFYIKLCEADPLHGVKGDLSWISRQILKAVIVLGVLVGVATTVTSLFDLIEPDAFTVPCYALSSSPSKGYSTNCTHVKLIPKPNTAEC